MGNEDMRYGRCSACGADEVYKGEYEAQGGLRSADALLVRQVGFDAYLCADCGCIQLHARLDQKMSSHIRKKFQWIPPHRPVDD